MLLKVPKASESKEMYFEHIGVFSGKSYIITKNSTISLKQIKIMRNYINGIFRQLDM